MRKIVSDYLDHKISRRAFVGGMLALGISLAEAEAMLASLEDSEGANQEAQAQPATSEPNSWSFEGTGGALVIEQAKAAGAEYLFANPGSLEVGFFDALVDTPGIQMIMGLHEGVVTSMGDAYARVSGKPGYILVHSIAGPAQMGGQLYNASYDGTPLVVTAGLYDNEMWSDDVHLAARPGYDEKNVNQQFTKIGWQVRDAASLPLFMRRAFKVATTAPGGPVFLALANYALEAKAVKAQILPARRFLLRGRVRPDADAVQEAARLLIEAKRPLVIVGDEIWKSGAQAEVLELAEGLGLAVGDTLTGYANFPVRSPLYLGQVVNGVRGGLNTQEEYIRRGIDLVLMIGSRDIGGYTVPESQQMLPGARIVRIGLDTNNMSRNYPTDVPLVGDVKQSVTDLRAAVDSLTTKQRLARLAAARSEEVRAITSAARAEQERVVRSHFGQNPMHQDEVGTIVGRMIDPDALIVDESYTGYKGAFHYGFRENEHMKVNNAGGSLGWGIGAASGAKLAAPNRQVVCSMGDGALMYSSAGFWTQARYGIPVLTFVWNNHDYQVVRWSFDRYHGRMAKSGHFIGMYLGAPDIDFVQLAESQGVKGERVRTAAELEEGLKRGIRATRDGKPYLLDVGISRVGPGADSSWYDGFNLAEHRARRV